MNQISEVITTLIHYKVVVRDTLEYALNKNEFDYGAYKEKKRSILVEIEQATPLKHIIESSGENGEKLLKLIKDFYDAVYGEGSTIVKVGGDNSVRVDHAQHSVLFNHVLPIHENVEGMIVSLINDAKKKGLDVSEVEKVDLAEEKLYRAVAYLTLTSELVKLFNDYNQARREAKGEETPASRFIANDLQNVISHLNAVKAASRITDSNFWDVQDKVSHLIEFMTGRRQIPAGQEFGAIIKDAQDSVNAYVREVEPPFREAYIPLIKELLEQAKSRVAEQKADKGEEKDDGEPVELDPATGLPKA